MRNHIRRKEGIMVKQTIRKFLKFFDETDWTSMKKLRHSRKIRILSDDI